MSWVRNAIKNIEAQNYEHLHQTVFGGYGTKPNVSFAALHLTLELSKVRQSTYANVGYLRRSSGLSIPLTCRTVSGKEWKRLSKMMPVG